jgi:hypothetical protein
MPSGWERSLVLAVGHPAGWLADQVPPLANAANKLSDVFKSNEDLSSGGAGSFADRSQPAAAGGVPPVTPDAFDPRSLGEKPAKRPLKTVLVHRRLHGAAARRPARARPRAEGHQGRPRRPTSAR